MHQAILSFGVTLLCMQLQPMMRKAIDQVERDLQIDRPDLLYFAAGSTAIDLAAIEGVIDGPTCVKLQCLMQRLLRAVYLQNHQLPTDHEFGKQDQSAERSETVE